MLRWGVSEILTLPEYFKEGIVAPGSQFGRFGAISMASVATAHMQITENTTSLQLPVCPLGEFPGFDLILDTTLDDTHLSGCNRICGIKIPMAFRAI